MGYSVTKIPFLVVDDSPIEVESASRMDWFQFTKLSDFASIQGGFSRTDKTPETIVFQSAEGDFAEFLVRRE